MNSWALIIAGLSFVLYFQLAPRFQPIAPASAAVNEERPTAPKKPAPASKEDEMPMTFGAYPCPAPGCAEDKAGFQWAARNRIQDPDDCTGTTAAFIEGCRVYAERQAPRQTAD